MGTIYGYCRCSTDDSKQDLSRQVRQIIAAGADEANIYTEYEHGTTVVKKQQQLLFKAMQAGDTLVITEVSRLTRSTKQLCELIEKIQQMKICLRIIDSVTIDCRNGTIDPMTKAFLQMAGVFSQLEREMASERTKSSLRNAKAKGKRLGRPTTTKDDIPPVFFKFYPNFAAGNMNKVQFARVCGLSRPTIDKYIELAKEG